VKNVTLLLFLFLTPACTYNIVQQQNGARARAPQNVSISGHDAGVGVSQSDGGQAVYIGRESYNDPPPVSFYPQYNGYSGSGGRYSGGPVGPAYDPRAWNVPNSQVWRYRVN
jgi:hypothetical protein